MPTLRNCICSVRFKHIKTPFLSHVLVLGILVTATKDKNNKYPYNPTTLVLLSETLKLVIAATLHCKEYVHEFTPGSTLLANSLLTVKYIKTFLYNVCTFLLTCLRGFKILNFCHKFKLTIVNSTKKHLIIILQIFSDDKIFSVFLLLPSWMYFRVYNSLGATTKVFFLWCIRLYF